MLKFATKVQARRFADGYVEPRVVVVLAGGWYGVCTPRTAKRRHYTVVA